MEPNKSQKIKNPNPFVYKTQDARSELLKDENSIGDLTPFVTSLFTLSPWFNIKVLHQIVFLLVATEQRLAYYGCKSLDD
ncbi:unnamed protein product [Trifolium pratense]|uniref:Uncharacterized protein n=1 Tax=Trifolium pratense TaxID=57577 RepID=A0ACB0JPT9_TRIPR|nr:unnamed protein product [Trifolium pratense]